MTGLKSIILKSGMASIALAVAGPALAQGAAAPAAPAAPAAAGASTFSDAEIKQFAALYERYKQKRGKAADSIDELKEWAKKLPKSETDILGVEDVDRAFVSPRDGQPYVIVPTRGAGRGGKGGPATRVIAYEKTGVNGKRFVLMPRGYTVMEMDEAQFREAVPGAP